MYNYTYGNEKTTIRPFEVVQVSDTEVAINHGVILKFGNIFQPTDINFSSDAKPQDLIRHLDPFKFLEVEAGDYVCLRISKETPPDLQIVAYNKAELAQNGQTQHYKTVVLAVIVDIDVVTETMLIEYRYKDDLVYQSLFFPSFTPIIWNSNPDVVADQNGNVVQQNVMNAIFTPGSVHLSHEPMMDPGFANGIGNPRIFYISGNGVNGGIVYDSMLNFPIMKVAENEKWYMEMPVNSSWTFANNPVFTNRIPTLQGDEKYYVIGNSPCESNPTGSYFLNQECNSQSARYFFPVMKFKKGVGGLYPEVYWKSDYIIHKNPRCENCGTGVGATEGKTAQYQFKYCESGVKLTLDFVDGLLTDISSETVDYEAEPCMTGTNLDDFYSGYQTHTGDSSIHFTEASIDHTNIQNIGSNTHAQIDSHISNESIHKVVEGATGNINLVSGGETYLLIGASGGLTTGITGLNIYAREYQLCDPDTGITSQKFFLTLN
jgi:hypothetical protein